MERFWAKVEKTDMCWRWTAARDRDGYGVFKESGHMIFAHRKAYALLRGEIPSGLTIDHLCRNTGCVNPSHMEPVTARENTLRGNALGAVNSRKTICGRGHPLHGDNLRVKPNGQRECKICRRSWNRKNKATARTRLVIGVK